VPFVLKLALPVVTGVIVGGLTMIGLVHSQTAAPASNPADQPVLTYGD
jgi:formate/nitrite transporter FocA (FNT family)